MRWIKQFGGYILADIEARPTKVLGVILKAHGTVYDSRGHRTYWHWYLGDNVWESGVTTTLADAKLQLATAYVKATPDEALPLKK